MVGRTWGARLHAVGPTAKLLVLPLLFYHFERSPRGLWVFIAFLASCTLLMLVSWVVAFDPDLSLKPDATIAGNLRQELHRPEPGICAVRGGAGLSGHDAAAGWQDAAGGAACGDRAGPAGQHAVRRGFAHRAGDHADHAGGIRAAAFEMANHVLSCAVGACCWRRWPGAASPQLRTDRHERSCAITSIYKETRTTDVDRVAAGILAEIAAVLCRGSRHRAWHRIDARAVRAGRDRPKSAPRGQVVGNPHNQTLNVAIQWGVLGVVVLYATWWLHLLLFRGEGLAAWIGLMVVVQNIFTSLFNSHLFDFHEGWMYVLGVGVAGGMVLGAGGAKLRSPIALARANAEPGAGYAC